MAVSVRLPQLSPDEFVREVKHLPSTPKVLPRLKDLLSDPNSSMIEIVALIRLDAGIAARVLQVGNSAYFAKSGRCDTVDVAVNRVGFDQVYELVSYAAAATVLTRKLEVYGISGDELWKASVVTAIAAEILGERTDQDQSVAYTAGLLHAIGMVVIDEFVHRGGYQTRLGSTGFPKEASEAERAALGFTQASVGAALMRAWSFSAEMAEAVRWQYQPRGAGGHIKMASLLYIAKWLKTIVCSGVEEPPPDPAILQIFKFTLEDLKKLTEAVQVRLAEVASLLEAAAHKSGGTNNPLPGNKPGF